jgi:hypothetical protein
MKLLGRIIHQDYTYLLNKNFSELNGLVFRRNSTAFTISSVNRTYTFLIALVLLPRISRTFILQDTYNNIENDFDQKMNV